MRPGARATVVVGTCAAKARRLIAARVTVRAAAAAPSQLGTTLTLRADPRGMPRFDRATLEAPAGRITLRLVNASPVPHNIA